LEIILIFFKQSSISNTVIVEWQEIQIKLKLWNYHKTDLFLCGKSINLQCMASPCIDHPNRDDTIIVQKFMEELCRRDKEDNRDENRDPNRRLNIFTVEEIWLAVLRAFSLGRVRVALRGHIKENRDNEPLEFLDNEVNVRLTNVGRAHCNEYGIHVHLE
jgi:hypothetical protein